MKSAKEVERDATLVVLFLDVFALFANSGGDVKHFGRRKILFPERFYTRFTLKLAVSFGVGSVWKMLAQTGLARTGNVAANTVRCL